LNGEYTFAVNQLLDDLALSWMKTCSDAKALLQELFRWRTLPRNRRCHNTPLIYLRLYFDFLVSSLVAGGTEYHKIVRLIAVKQITGEMDSMQLQCLVMLPTLRTSIFSLFTQAPFQMVHLAHMYNIQADMKKQAQQN